MKHFVENSIVDGVLRYPETGIKVIIVGGGPAGYLAALESWRKGHTVEILEKNQDNSIIGDYVIVGPSGLATLKYYPSMLQDYLKCSHDAYSSFRRMDGELAMPEFEFEWNRAGIPEHAAFPLRIRSMITRPGMATMFYNQCQRLGIPIRFGVTILDYIEDTDAGTGTAVDNEGRSYTADIVVAADGLGTKSHKAVLGEVSRAFPTGFAVSRIMYPTNELKDAPHLKAAIAKLERPDLHMYTGPNYHCLVYLSDEYIGIFLTTADDGTAEESWVSGISPDEVLKRLPDPKLWEPLVMEAFHNIPNNNIVKWKLCWRDPQTKWTTPGGRIIQIGDAAHAFIPSSIAGAQTALEDAQSLAECLRLAGKKDANFGTKVHEFLRYRRTATLQRTGFVNRREMHRESGMEDVVKDSSEHGPLSIGKWVWTHNPEHYATQNFAKAREHLLNGADFEHTNLPVGFKWEPWSMADEAEKEKLGIRTPDLKTNGDWSVY